MTKQNKLEAIYKGIQYALDHYKVIDDRFVDKLKETTYDMLYDVCSETCGGIYHCTDGCPIYYLMVELINNENVKCQ
jgi:hypothetical protein